MDTSQRDEALIVLSGLPTASTQESQRVLSRFLLQKLQAQDPDDHAKIYVPVDINGHTVGLAIVRYASSDAADAGISAHNGTALDRNHTMVAERPGSSQAFGSTRDRGGIDEQRMRGVTALQTV
ncbi:Translation initiation factor 3 subunit b [Saxophila tyrrhenica]|uniref:Translation initiation factor 3 subunit b n=1 Tax=Saxophila tyrrhenica TaxID=1690608 RepID=A0AAV9PJG8_9PEZI|nr:Translation initiation factor 3 subunit b [Saxophila tyrrhenica]